MTDESKGRLERAVTDALARTRGDVVVAVAHSSGSYRDVDHLVGAVVALVGLVVALSFHYRDRSLPEEMILPGLALLYGAALVAGSNVPLLRRALTSAARRSRQVRDAARAAFVREGVGSAAERAGVLVYVSLLERRVEVVPGLGAEGKVEGARWAAVARDVDFATAGGGALAGAERAVAAAGALLAQAFPRLEGSPPAGAPRVVFARDAAARPRGDVTKVRDEPVDSSVPSSLADVAFHAAIEQRVAAAEARTDAEVVVALASSSSTWHHAGRLGGAVAAAASLALVIHVPHVSVPHRDVLPIVVVAYFLGQLAVSRVAALRRLLFGRRWGERAVAEAADLAFFEEHVAATEGRSGVLVFASALERSVRIVADTGVDGRVTPERWDVLLRDQESRLAASFPGGILSTIDAVGDVLSGALPKTTHQANELSNAPRVRP